MTNKLLNGLILAGGKSSRLGFNKSQLQYHGRPQCTYLADLLAPFCNRVFISGRKTDAEPGVSVLTDYYEIEGPLNGILTALRHEPRAAWLTMPVDMPNIDTALIQFLITHRNPRKTATCFLDSTGIKPEPLLAVWEAGVFEKLSTYYSGGGRSPREFLQANPVELLRAPSPTSLLNINTPEDLAEFKRTLHPGKQGI